MVFNGDLTQVKITVNDTCNPIVEMFAKKGFVYKTYNLIQQRFSAVVHSDICLIFGLTATILLLNSKP